MYKASDNTVPCYNAFTRDGRFAGYFPGPAEHAAVAAFAQNYRRDYNVNGYQQYNDLIKHEGDRVFCGPIFVEKNGAVL